MSVSRPIGDLLVVFFCCSCLTPQGSPGVSLLLLSPHLCFIMGFICDLFVARNDSLMS